MKNDLIVQSPAQPRELVLLFHGVGSSATDLVPLGQALASHHPDAQIVSVQAPDAIGQGWQWFTVQGISEENRPARVAAALPGFNAAVRSWQQASGADAGRTTLIGFSQGAIMALEATQADTSLAGRVFALSGRFAKPPRVAPPGTLYHLMQGDADPLMPVSLAIDSHARLLALQARATLDRFPGLGHAIDARVVDAILGHFESAQSSTG
jgi:phospholipase/carboxylesterase